MDRRNGLRSQGIAAGAVMTLEDSRELVYASQKWLAGRYTDDAAAWGFITPERWNAFYGWLSEHDLTANDLSGKGFSNDYLQE